jgi:hypothetical protein
MATKSDFTAEEWQTMKWAAADTMAYLSMADPGFWDSFKEASAAAKFVATQRTSSDSLLVRDLAGDVDAKRDRSVSGNPTDIAGGVVARVSAAAALVAQKDAADLPAFKAYIIGLAQTTAEAANGVGTNEAEAIEKITTALG